MNTTHELKTDPAPFSAVYDGIKTFEIRLNDRGFKVGDKLLLRETQHSGEAMKGGAPLAYTGREITKTVSHVLAGYGLADGWCCLSFAAEIPGAGPETAEPHSAEWWLNWRERLKAADADHSQALSALPEQLQCHPGVKWLYTSGARAATLAKDAYALRDWPSAGGPGDARNAERYRKLKARASFTWSTASPTPAMTITVPAPNHSKHRGYVEETFDADIDAAVDALHARAPFNLASSNTRETSNA